MSGEQMSVCTVCACVLACWRRGPLGSCVCSLASSCGSLTPDARPCMQLRPCNQTQRTNTHIYSLAHKKRREKVYYTMTCSGGHIRDGGEKERDKRRGRGDERDAQKKESREGLLWTHQRRKKKKVPPLLLPLAPPFCKRSSPLLSFPLLSFAALFFLLLPLLSPACDLSVHEAQKNTMDVKWVLSWGLCESQCAEGAYIRVKNTILHPHIKLHYTKVQSLCKLSAFCDYIFKLLHSPVPQSLFFISSLYA